jgi:hypothetical protein
MLVSQQFADLRRVVPGLDASDHLQRHGPNFRRSIGQILRHLGDRLFPSIRGALLL